MPAIYVSFLENLTTILVIVITGWISWLLWRSWQTSGASQNIILSVAFGFVSAYKISQLIFDSLLGIQAVHWMNNEVASEGLIVLLMGVIIWVLTRGVSARKAAGRR